MSTYTTSSTRLNTSLSAQVAKQLRISLNNSALLRAARADLRVTAEDLTALEHAITEWDPSLTAALLTLSPAEHARAQQALADARIITRERLDASQAAVADRLTEAKTQLAHALTRAQHRIDDAIAESTAQVVAAAGRHLGYRVTRRRDGHTTAIDMRREHEIVLAVVREDTLEVDHAGLADATCLHRQGELFAEIHTRGVELVENTHDEHRDDTGGALIRAVVDGDAVLLTDPAAFALAAARRTERIAPATDGDWLRDGSEDLDGPRIPA